MEQQSNRPENRTQQRPAPRRERIRLPFENKKQDPMNWIYDNRIGLFTTIIVFLVAAVVFVTAKIVTKVQDTPDTIYIEMDFTQEPEKQPEKPKEKPKARENIDWSKVRNTSSNEAAKEFEKDQALNRINDAELRAAAEAIQKGLNENMEAYERGLAEVNAIGQDSPKEKEPANKGKVEDSKRKGNVMVSYCFEDPTRHATYLVKPAYRCEGGGEVVVAAVLSPSGKVISAKVESGGDACMRNVAVSAALGSTFDINHDAPKKHEGTITYIFIPQ